MLPSEILDRAADIIVRDGWIQGSYYRPAEYDYEFDDEVNRQRDIKAAATAPCCQAGAIARAAHGVAWQPTPFPALTLIEARVKAEGYMQLHLGVTSAICWNDEAGRTAEEVVEALRCAAALARREGE